MTTTCVRGDTGCHVTSTTTPPTSASFRTLPRARVNVLCQHTGPRAGDAQATEAVVPCVQILSGTRARWFDQGVKHDNSSIAPAPYRRIFPSGVTRHQVNHAGWWRHPDKNAPKRGHPPRHAVYAHTRRRRCTSAHNSTGRVARVVCWPRTRRCYYPCTRPRVTVHRPAASAKREWCNGGADASRQQDATTTTDGRCGTVATTSARRRRRGCARAIQGNEPPRTPPRATARHLLPPTRARVHGISVLV